MQLWFLTVSSGWLSGLSGSWGDIRPAVVSNWVGNDQGNSSHSLSTISDRIRDDWQAWIQSDQIGRKNSNYERKYVQMFIVDHKGQILSLGWRQGCPFRLRTRPSAVVVLWPMMMMMMRPPMRQMLV